MFFFSKTQDVQDDFKMKLKDIQFKQTIGKGAFGRVRLCNFKDFESKIFACKIIKKKQVLQRVIRLKEEIVALQSIKSPFVVHLFEVFQDEFKIYIVQEYLKGDFLDLLKQQKKFTEKEAKFYFVQVYLGLVDIHKKSIVYRDLKPENMLMDDEGNLKLCDFGLCKQLKKSEKTYSHCGTLDYESPEIILGDGHDFTTDYWSLGIFLYELLVGKTPFFHINDKKTAENILQGEFKIPDDLSKEATDLIRSLIERDVEKRKKNFSQIPKHPWLSDVNWNDAKSKKLKPPCKIEIEKVRGNLRDSLDVIETPLNKNEKKIFEELAKLCKIKE